MNHGISVILFKNASNTLLGYVPLSDRVIKLKIQSKPHNLSIIQCYAPTSAAAVTKVEQFYQSLQETIDTCPNRGITLVVGDFNAKVGTSTF